VIGGESACCGGEDADAKVAAGGTDGDGLGNGAGGSCKS
jgi:hypothetical protein